MALVVFVATGGILLKYYLEGEKEQAVFNDLSDRITIAEGSSNSDEIPSERFKTAYGENSDYVGWLTVPGTAIDYPVMYTPNDSQYYLHHSFDKSDSKSGTLFVGENGRIDSISTIIYGHNMKNDTMFGTLDSYKDQAFWEGNRYFSIETAEGTKNYEIFAAVQTLIPKENVGKLYYECVGDLSPEEYSQIVTWLLDNSIYKSDAVPPNSGQLVMLSTCSYHTDDGRFLIAGIEVE